VSAGHTGYYSVACGHFRRGEGLRHHLIPAAFGPLEGDLQILPKHHFETEGPLGFEEKPLGSAPWKFVKRKVGQFIEFEANLNHWNPERIPGFAKLRMVLVPESRTRVSMLRRGNSDLISLEPQDVEPLKKDGYQIIGPRDTGIPCWSSIRTTTRVF
jgi:ABC-type transport system substrate-binding protein